VFILFPITGIFLPFVTIGNDFETVYQIVQPLVVLIFMWLLHIILQYFKRRGFRTDTFYTYLQVHNIMFELLFKNVVLSLIFIGCCSLNWYNNLCFQQL
jgi:uncharacterized membrane protein